MTKSKAQSNLESDRNTQLWRRRPRYPPYTAFELSDDGKGHEETRLVREYTAVEETDEELDSGYRCDLRGQLLGFFAISYHMPAWQKLFDVLWRFSDNLISLYGTVCYVSVRSIRCRKTSYS